MMKKLRKKTGYSLAETMLVLLLVGLLSMSIATGVAFGARQYSHAMARSEARVLCSSLKSIIQNELRNTTKYRQVDADTLEFESTYFGEGDGDTLSRFDQDSDEFIVVTTGDKSYRLLGEASYSGKNSLTAEVESVQYDSTAGVFHVALVVHTNNSAGDIRSDFDVIPLNELKPVADPASP